MKTIKINTILHFDIFQFRKLGFIIDGERIYKTFSMDIGKKTKLKIDYECNLIHPNSYIQLKYKTILGNEPIEYKINLIKQESNLKKGHYYFLECPLTKRKAIRLYKTDYNNYFVHRLAFTNQERKHQLLYSSQYLDSAYYYQKRKKYLIERAKELQKKVVKSHYQGKPTRLQQRIESLLRKADEYHEKQEQLFNKRLFRFMFKKGWIDENMNILD